ncbi:Ig-like domain-containing protein [Clostridium taeniosporum]|uniref:BIG2 domain-containing protein n=1 Tax=Clostridium taeniosporum TaxID=394958 RepID=A0A1D7XKM0_9CLOT|nr:Ig-like domain-containing protein [Clostridium taeniosporum]AOR23882.1 hypothetical protein BGI42_09155 [Clostridium taeniosporum]
MDNNKTIYNVIKKSIADYGQPVAISKNTDSNIDYDKKAIVKYKNQAVQNSNMFIELQDQYEFIMLDKVKYNHYIYWNNAYYKIVSIDNTTEGVYKVYTKFNNVIEKHTYTININNTNSINIKVGQTVKLDCICTKDGEIDQNPTITYISDNINIISVVENGVVKAITEGSTIINVFYNGVKDSININVEKADEFSINCNDIQLDVGSTIQLKAICMKNGIEVKDPTCNYTIADSSIVTISENGDVNGFKEGSTTISIYWEGITKTINVKVNKVAQIDYIIEGVDKFKQKTQATFTISPMIDNSRLEVDPIDIQCDTVKVIGQSNGTITLLGQPVYSDSEFTLYAYVGDKKVASKIAIVSKR